MFKFFLFLLFLLFLLIENYWAELEHRRTFFDEFAQKHKFDPLLVENWYSISRNALEADKVSQQYYIYIIINY